MGEFPPHLLIMGLIKVQDIIMTRSENFSVSTCKYTKHILHEPIKSAYRGDGNELSPFVVAVADKSNLLLTSAFNSDRGQRLTLIVAHTAYEENLRWWQNLLKSSAFCKNKYR